MAQGWEEEDMGASYGSPAQWGAGWALAQCREWGAWCRLGGSTMSRGWPRLDLGLNPG